MKTYVIEYYQVCAPGGQIGTWNRPEKTAICLNEGEKELFEKHGFTWDSCYKYFDTYEHAQKAIDWALSN